MNGRMTTELSQRVIPASPSDAGPFTPVWAIYPPSRLRSLRNSLVQAHNRAQGHRRAPRLQLIRQFETTSSFIYQFHQLAAADTPAVKKDPEGRYSFGVFNA